MNNIEQLRSNRERFLILLYEKTNQDINEDVDYREISEELGLDENEGWKIYDYLKAKGFADSTVMGGYINITIYGIDLVEDILSDSGIDANNSQQVMNFIHVQNMNNSQITQGSTQVNQTLNITENQSVSLSEFVKLFEQKIEEILFDSEDEKSEAIAEVSTIKSQLNSPKPKWEIIKLAGGTVKGILEKAAGSIVAQQLLELLKNSL